MATKKPATKKAAAKKTATVKAPLKAPVQLLMANGHIANDGIFYLNYTYTDGGVTVIFAPCTMAEADLLVHWRNPPGEAHATGKAPYFIRTMRTTACAHPEAVPPTFRQDIVDTIKQFWPTLTLKEADPYLKVVAAVEFVAWKKVNDIERYKTV